jgi:CPA2 family monovalent cation:H+ antiporter-2
MEHLPGLIKDLALILITAAAVTLLFRRIKQPLVLGYIIAGFLVGPHLSLTPTIVEMENIKTLAQMGVIFLLFSMGLEFSFKKLVRVGGAASITAFVEIIFILIAGFYLGRWLGWSFMDSIFLGGMLASSSTAITIKALDELGMKAKQFARVVFGVLIVQDIVVILLMVMLSTIAITRQIEGSEMLFTVARLLFFLGLWFITGIFLIPTLLRSTKKLLNEETLLILSVGLCLGMVVLAVQAGFSAELGAFIMGSILAETSKAEKIEKIFNPVRDLFAGIFFVSVGMLIDPETIIQYRWPVLWITLLTVFGKFFSLTIGALMSGQPLKQSIQVGMSMAQVGEFAFIIATLGMSLGVISNFLFPVAVGAAVITTFTTPYLIKLAIPVYNFTERNMPPYIRRKLANYAASAQNIEAESKWRNVMMAYVKILTINGIILFGMMLLSLRALMPFLQKHIENVTLASTIGLLISLAVASPFLWAFIARKPETIAYKELWLKKKYYKGPLLMVELTRLILGIVFIGFWADRIFTTTVALFIAIAISVVLLILFSRKIQNFYHKIEFRFLDNLNHREMLAQQSSTPELFSDESNMVSWDAHLVNMVVDPHTLFIGKHLMELKWREKYGINIAFIKRGNKIIYAPKGYDRLLPFDEIGVIATDDQITLFLEEFNTKEPIETEEKDLSNIVLFKMVVDEKNKLKGKTIRNSNIRERTNGLVVGIERENQRILNPESDVTFEWGDIIWIVGEREKLQSINRSES